MHDDDFDQRLARRLAAYEGRIPGAQAPDYPGGLETRGRPFHWPMWVTGGAAVVVGALLAVLLLNRPESPVGEASAAASPSAPASAALSPSPAATASAATTPSATASPGSSVPVSGLDWSSTAVFGGDGGPAMVEDVASTDSGLIAIGVSYRSPLPNVGPTPLHRARVWTSADGRSWSEVALGEDFENVTLEHLIVRADGSLLALGHQGSPADGMIFDVVAGAWSSVDGVTWRSDASGLPRTPTSVAHGAMGYLALLPPAGIENEQELWYSGDGFGWELVHTLPPAWVHIGAGNEGFVATGRADNGVEGDPGRSFAMASSDGREWFDAPSPPVDVGGVAPIGPDWVAVTGFPGTYPVGRVWHSADGLDWRQRGDVPLSSADTENGECYEYPRVLSDADAWLIVSGEYVYPCSEGGYLVHGTQWISRDGVDWERLPFPPGTLGDWRSGAAVSGAVEADAGLVLVGEEDGQAAFWLGEGS